MQVVQAAIRALHHRARIKTDASNTHTSKDDRLKTSTCKAESSRITKNDIAELMPMVYVASATAKNTIKTLCHRTASTASQELIFFNQTELNMPIRTETIHLNFLAEQQLPSGLQ